VIYKSAGNFDVFLDVQRPRTSAQHLAHDPRLLEAPRHLQLERGMLGSFGVDRMPRGASQRRFPLEVETEAALLQRSDGRTGPTATSHKVPIRSARALSTAVLTKALVPTTEVGALHSNKDLDRHFSHFFSNHFVPNAEK
jgi:hypothetical protein